MSAPTADPAAEERSADPPPDDEHTGEPNEPHRVEGRAEIGRFLALVGASAVAVTQPLLSTFGTSPETFIFRDADGADLVWFALTVALVPPVVVWLAGFTVGLVAPRLRRPVHAVSVGVLLGLGALQVLVDVGRPLALPLAAVVGIGAGVAVRRWSGAHLWLQFLAVLAPFAVAGFLCSSEAADALRGGSFDELDATDVPADGEALAPVVMVVFDEWPLTSLLTAGGGLDAERFPNLARLAQDADWFRNATTVNGWTTNAVPAIVTGRLPDNSPPVWSNHPDSLFRLFAPTHDLVVSESLTLLCPPAVCGERPTAPVADGAADESAPARVDADRGGLLSDAAEVWLDRVRGDVDRTDAFEQFTESIVSTPAEPGDDEPTGVDDEFEAEGTVPDRVGEADVVGQPVRLTEWLDALVPADRPVFGFLHLELPHTPWRFLPDGTAWEPPATEAQVARGIYGSDWGALVARHTHLLQASYADALLGRILDHLEAQDLYDEAVVVVTADHGVSFARQQVNREVTDASEHEILWVPLFVKAPGQTGGSVSDANVETVDLAPTVAELAGRALPWEVDGVPVTDEVALAARGDTKRYAHFSTFVDQRPDEFRRVDGAEGLERVLDDTFGELGPGDDPVSVLYEVAGLGDVLGRRLDPRLPTADSGWGFTVDDVDRFATAEVPLVVSGRLDQPDRAPDPVDPVDLADPVVTLVLDDVVVAASPTVVRADGTTGFVAVLPVDTRLDLVDLRLVVHHPDDPDLDVDLGPVLD